GRTTLRPCRSGAGASGGSRPLRAPVGPGGGPAPRGGDPAAGRIAPPPGALPRDSGAVLGGAGSPRSAPRSFAHPPLLLLAGPYVQLSQRPDVGRGQCAAGDRDGAARRGRGDRGESLVRALPRQLLVRPVLGRDRAGPAGGRPPRVARRRLVAGA